MEDTWNSIECKKYIGKDIYNQNTIFSKLFSVNYFLILNDDDNKTKSNLLLEMQSNLKKSPNFFAFFCFIKLTKREVPNLPNENYYFVSDHEPLFKEYFLFCFEGNCYIFYTKAKDFKKNLQFLFEINKKVLLIGNRNDDIARFKEIFNIKDENMKKFEAKSIENKFILLNEKYEINEIENDVNTIMNEPLIIGLNNQLKKSNQTIYDIIKLISFRIIMTYSIRRFYFPINSFSDPSFFVKEKDFLDKTKKYTNVSYLNKKYKPQINIKMKEMNIKNFIILRSIGNGSSATIYLSFHIYEEQLFVIKKFKDSACFEKEKNNYSKLIYYHPNIIKCYGFTNDNSLIIEFMCNGTLQKLIKMKPNQNSFFSHFVSPFDLYSSSNYFHNQKVNFFNNRANKIKMIIEIIFGLEYLHMNDMIYCDMKPDNIFIDHNFMIRLGDFDLSCNCNFLSSKSNKVGNIDSVNYFSPDISLNENGYYTYISDNFQLGLIIYAICKGDDLFQNISIENASQINKFIKNKSIPFLFGPFCSFFIDCLKTQAINRKNLCNIIIELSENQHFFDNLIKENHCYFYYTDIVEELHILYQNLYEIFFGFVNLFSEEILNQSNEKRNIRQYELVLNHLFYIPSLKNMRNYLSEEIQIILNYCENQIQNKKDKMIEILKNLFYRTLYFIYSDENYCLHNIHKSTEYLLLGVKNNDTLSQNCIALKFFDGNEIFKKDLNKSILFFTLSADSGCENAQYNLGEIYTNLYSSPIRLKIPELNIDTNDQLFFANQALKYYKLAKKQNNSAALYALAAIYNNGELGFKKDKRKAISYLIRSKTHFYQVSIDSFLSFFSVGLIYSNYDIGIFEKEASFLSESFGNVVAQYELGNFYLKQIKDIEKAKKYFKMACKQNHRIAVTSLANIYLEESKRNKSIELEKESFKYFLQAADLNEPNALFYVACRYFFGDRPYIKIDQQKALYFFQKAFALNSPRAQKFLGYIYFKGCYPIVEPNIGKAIYCFNLAAKNPICKENDAMDILGLIYLEGKIVAKDVKLSLEYFKNAKNLRSHLSTHQLGFLYEVGEKRLTNNLDLIQNEIFPSQFQIYMLNFSYINNLDDLKQNDDSYNIKSIPDLAIQYYKESSSPPSIYNLAAIYYSGIHVQRDVLLAINLLQKIAKYIKYAAFFLFRIFSTGEPNLVKIDGKKAVYYLNLSGISPLNCHLTIDVLKNSRFSYQMIYYTDINTQANKAQNIDINFYEGLLEPRIENPAFDYLYNY